jgi:hypothetical protein
MTTRTTLLAAVLYLEAQNDDPRPLEEVEDEVLAARLVAAAVYWRDMARGLTAELMAAYDEIAELKDPPH